MVAMSLQTSSFKSIAGDRTMKLYIDYFNWIVHNDNHVVLAYAIFL